jgi:hypothetical protein
MKYTVFYILLVFYDVRKIYYHCIILISYLGVLYTVYCILYTVYCILCTIYCILHTRLDGAETVTLKRVALTVPYTDKRGLQQLKQLFCLICSTQRYCSYILFRQHSHL